MSARVSVDVLRVTRVQGFSTPETGTHSTVKKRAVAVNESGRIVGQDHPRSKLTDHEVDLVIELREGGMKLAEVAAKFEISVSSVVHYCKGRRRSQVAVDQRQPGRHRDRCQARPARPAEFPDCT